MLVSPAVEQDLAARMKVTTGHLLKRLAPTLEAPSVPDAASDFRISWHSAGRGWRVRKGGQLFLTPEAALKHIRSTKGLSSDAKKAKARAKVSAGALRPWKHVVFHKSKGAWVINKKGLHHQFGLFQDLHNHMCLRYLSRRRHSRQSSCITSEH